MTEEEKVVAQPVVEGFALSAQQARLWRRAVDAGLLPEALRARAEVAIAGEIEPSLLRAAAGWLAERHEALRATLHAVPGLALPVQAVAAPAPPAWREVHGATVERAWSEEAGAPLDLAAGPALRLALVRLAPGDHRLLLTAPSLCADGRSLEVLVAELAAAYAALVRGAEPAAEPPLQYLDFCAWQDELLAGEGAAGAAFWRRPGALPRHGPAALPFERPVPGGAPREPLRRGLRLDGLDLAAAAGRAGVPLAAFLLAGWQVLLARLTGGREVAVGAVFDGRRHAELAHGVGLYARWLPVVAEVSMARPFAAAARAAAGALAAVADHQEAADAGGPDAPVVPDEALVLPRGFEHRRRPAAIDAAGARFEILRCAADLACPAVALAVVEGGGDVEIAELELSADPAALADEELGRLAGRLAALLRAAAADPEQPAGELEIVGEEERRLVLDAWNATRWEPPSRASVAELFAGWAERAPQALAASAGGVSLTYGELDRRSRRLAHRLLRLGVGPETPVGVAGGATVELLVAVLGIWRAGGAYLPLDPGSPPARRAALLAAAGAPMVVGAAADLGDLPGFAGRRLPLDGDAAAEDGDSGPLPAAPDPATLAYLIFTSGSTGRPKGVAVTHASLAHYSQWIAAELLGEGDRPLRFAAVSTPAADLGHTALFPALVSGGSVHLLAAEARDARRFREALRREAIDVLKVVPGHLEALLPAADEPVPLPATIVLGGDRLSWRLVERLRRLSPASRIVNHYGPTEATVGALACRVGEMPGERPGPAPWEASVPIGRPIGNARAYLLDAALRPVPAGVAGELWLGGAGLARGYAGQPDATAAAFTPDPFGDEPGGRLYRTGDLARHLPDGAVEFLGRADDQVKVRGFRVEPAEVEAALGSHPAVREATVLALADAAGERRLVAFAVPRRPAAGGDGLGTLPDGRPIHQLNPHETEFFYRQIFVDQGNLRHGIELPEGAVVFDVGANIGLFTLFVAERCPGAAVWAFEPVPEVFEALRQNLELHAPGARALPYGLADAGREVELTYYPRESCMSGLYADPERDRGTLERILGNAGLGAADAGRLLDERTQRRSVRCRLRTLSEVLREEGVERIDLLKIDVERAELDVLRGIADEDWPRIRQVVIEAHDIDGRLAEVAALLRRQGFDVVVEQAPELAGTELHDVYARRDGGREPVEMSRGGGSAAGAAHELAPREALRASTAQTVALRPRSTAPPLERHLHRLTPDDLRRHAAERLPEAMVPAAFVIVDELPRTANGKLDRARLAELADAAGRERPAAVPPGTPAERALAEVWREVLGLEEVGAADNFFALGGDSIRMIQMRYRAEERGWSFPAQQALDTPVLRDLARLATPVAPAAPAAEPASAAFALLSAADRARVPAGVEDAYPLTALQAGMLFHSAYTEGSETYKDVQTFRLRCRLDPAALAAALAEVVARHPILRTSFDLAGDGEPLQLVHAAVTPPLAVADLRALPAAAREAAVAGWTERQKRRPWDWSEPPLFRVAVHLLGEDEVSLGLATHHAVLDGWSNAVLLTEWLRLYLERAGGPAAGLGAAPPPLFRRLVELEREALASPAAERFWRERLADAPPTRLAGEGAAGGTRVLAVPLDPEVPPRLEEAARALGLPLKSVLLAAHLRVLALATGQREVVTGLVASRRPESAGADRALGLFLTTLPLRSRAAPGTWAELARAAFDAERQALAHRHYPVERLQRERASGAGPLFDTVFNFNHFHVLAEVRGMTGVEVLGGTTFEETSFPVAASFDRHPVSGRLQLWLLVHPRRVGADAVDRLAGWYGRALAALARDPGDRHEEARLLSAAEERQVLVEWSGAALVPEEAPPILEQVAAAARRRPDAPAAVTGRGEGLDYGELLARAGRLAACLHRLGVGPDVPVGLFADPSPEMIVGMLGILAAGGAYVPLDPDYPRQRLELMIAGAGVPVVVAQRRLRERLPETAAQVVELEAARLGEDDGAVKISRGGGSAAGGALSGHLAYVIFTSGSTGGPKGVLVERGALARWCLARRRAYGRPVEVFLLLPSISFDASVACIFGTLVHGGTLVLADAEERRDPEALAELVARHRVTHLLALPTLYAALLERGGDRLATLRTAIVAGEACPPGLVARHRERLPGAELFNEYGPTEGTVSCTLGHDEEGEVGLPIGRPIPGSRIYLLDADGQPVPPGVPGELWLGGNLARGYAGRPDATADRFRPDPFGPPGERLYRTGDLACHLPDGRIDFLGRVDRQLKVRGHRLEPEEIEAALESLPRIAAAAVAPAAEAPAAGGGADHLRLVAYCVPREAELPPAAELRAALQERLPAFAVPAAFVALPELPRLPNGKVDRTALRSLGVAVPEPVAAGAAAGSGEEAPRTPVERLLAEVWARVLRRERIGLHDDFFDLGGDSILSLQIVVRAGEAGLRISPKQVFEHPTIAELARVASPGAAAHEEMEEVEEPGGPLPLTPIQRWFFEREPADPHHWNQPVLLAVRRPPEPARLAAALGLLIARHDALRLRFSGSGAAARAEVGPPPARPPLHVIDLSAIPESARPAALDLAAASLQSSLDLERGPLLRAGWLRTGADGGRLLLVAHHLVTDAVSWGVLLPELDGLLDRLHRGEPPRLPPRPASFRRWAGRLAEHARSPEAEAELGFWLEQGRRRPAPLPVDLPGGENTVGRARSFAAALPEEDGRALVGLDGRAVEEVLVAALLAAVTAWSGERALLVDLEGHGREPLFPDLDVSGTVGWFTALYPLLLEADGAASPAELLAAVRERLRRVPRRGIGWGLLRFGEDGQAADALAALPAAEVSFNYLGRVDPAPSGTSWLTLLDGGAGPSRSPRGGRRHLLEVNCLLAGGRLRTSWTYGAALHREETVRGLAGRFLAAVPGLAAAATAPPEPVALGLGAATLDRVLAELNRAGGPA